MTYTSFDPPPQFLELMLADHLLSGDAIRAAAISQSPWYRLADLRVRATVRDDAVGLLPRTSHLVNDKFLVYGVHCPICERERLGDAVRFALPSDLVDPALGVQPVPLRVGRAASYFYWFGRCGRCNAALYSYGGRFHPHPLAAQK